MAKKDLKFISENPSRSLNPVARTTASVNGSSVDIRDYESAQMLVHIGAWTDATATITLQESSDNSTFTDVAAADLEFTADTIVNSSGQVVVAGTATDNASRSIGYAGDEPYLRAHAAVTTATTGSVIGVDIQRGHKKLKGKLNS